MGFLLAILAMLLIGFVTFVSLKSRTESRQRVAHTLEVVSSLQRIQSAVIGAETGQRGYLLTGEESYLAPYLNAGPELTSEQRRLKALTIDNPQQQQRLTLIEKLIDEKLTEMQRTITLRRAGETQSAMAMVRTDRGRALMEQIRALIMEMNDEEQALLQAREQQWQQASQFSVWVTVGGTVLLLVLISVAAISASRDYRSREFQVWLRSALMRFNTRIQGEQRLGKLGENVLAFLADHLDAQVGAVFMSRGDGAFHRFAGYAVPAAADTGTAIRPGDGLLGQAARQRRLLRIRDVPDNYLPVASSLGSGQPRELLIAPAVIDDEVLAIVELGFLQPTSPAQRELLARVSESLAAAVKSSKDRTRLEDLLEETQRQSEELQTQQEELRVSNEELEVQTQALRRVADASRSTASTSFRQSNVQLEEYTQMLEQQRDELARAQTVLAQKAAELERSNQYKVRVPRQHVARAAHAAQQLADSRETAGRQSRRQSHRRTGEVREQHLFGRQRSARAHQRHSGSVEDRSAADRCQARARSACSSCSTTCAQTFRPMASQKDIAFEIELAADSPAVLHTDSQRLRQILKNLLSNALKFTMQGDVRLSVFVPTAADEADWIAFAVADTGIGIAPEQQEHHFRTVPSGRRHDQSPLRRHRARSVDFARARRAARWAHRTCTARPAPAARSRCCCLRPCR